MTWFDRFTLFFAAMMALVAAHNAKEAHRHAHELACHVQADDLCKFHEEPK